MVTPFHQSAKPFHYNKNAEHYDAFNEENSASINQTLASIFKRHSIKTVADFTCGTGSQVFWLTQQGFNVVGCDINAKMLKIACQKAKQKKLKINFIQGDVRSNRLGKLDAAITIFNAIGHLTKTDFEIAIKNIHSNLNQGGLYIFDIFNLNYLLQGDNITKLTIDWQKTSGTAKIRDIQYSTISEDGILASYTISHVQYQDKPDKISKSFQTLQVYSASQLEDTLMQNSFKVVSLCNPDGSTFSETKSERILVVAQAI